MGRADQQRLTAVQDHADLGEPVPGGVRGDPGGRPADGGELHPARPGPPALVGRLVHVAVVAGQVAATVDLQQVLAERQYGARLRACRSAERVPSRRSRRSRHGPSLVAG